tara:strand:+ start:10881 stop:11660 length:780 start_codon:yes stop_codon:yes gene_type:complete
MALNVQDLVLISLAFFLVATLYSAVGFGGGSSYLAILTLVFADFYDIRTIALLCNLTVVTASCYLYYKKGHLDLKKFLPFVLASIPLAFLGARFRLQEHIFFIILGASLVISSIALAVQTLAYSKKEGEIISYPPFLTYVLGGSIGFLSGLVGIGGGIFLAPVLNHIKWDRSIKIAALASFFILVNSVSGISGLLSQGTFQMPWHEGAALLVAVFLGGQLGIRISLGRLTANGIKLITAILVLIVGLRVFFINGLRLTF